MKVKFDTAGSSPLRPDFEMLRAGLAAAQAATPTALAAHVAHPAIEPLEALYALFAGDNPVGTAAAANGSFHSLTAGQLDRMEI